MTGFGRQEFQIKDKKFCVDVKSLNSKQTDINTKIPSIIKEKELEIRKMLSSKLVRGKIEMYINIEASEDSVNNCVNEEAVKSYYNTLQKIAEDNKIPLGDEILSSILKMPEVLQANKTEFTDEDWEIILDNINIAIDKCINYRMEEGRSLEKDIKNNINSILDLLGDVIKYEDERVNSIKSRLFDNLKKIKLETDSCDNRYEQEIIYYLEKLDINEEKIRLEKHCRYFLETLELSDSQGKKLGFITQEIGREINTLGSKANHAEMQKLVVNMKDELEKVKEQLFNVL